MSQELIRTRTAVRALLLHCGPSNIPWLVMSVVIYAVNRVLVGWTRANVGKECLVTVRPFLADFNTASAVVIPSGTSRISASLFNALPDHEFRSARTAASRSAMLSPRRTEISCEVEREATAGLNSACLQRMQHVNALFAAIATTLHRVQPSAAIHAEFFWRWFKHNETAKPVAEPVVGAARVIRAQHDALFYQFRARSLV